MRRLGAAAVALIVALGAAAEVSAHSGEGVAVSASMVALPPGATVNLDAELQSVACSGAGSCVAAGTDTITLPGGSVPNRAMVALGNGASLSGATTLAPPAGADPTKPQGGSPVYCADSGDCVAFGGYRTTHGAYEIMVATEHGSHWSKARALAIPAVANLPGADGSASLSSVACTGPGNCVATLGYGPIVSQAALVSETAGVLRRVTRIVLPLGTKGSPWAALSSVSCVSAGNCVAVGDYDTPSYGLGVPIEVAERSGVWGRAVRLQPPAGTPTSGAFAGGYVASVSCTAPGACAAVGDYEDTDHNTRGFVVSESHGVWSRATPIAQPADGVPLTGKGSLSAGGPVMHLFAIACLSPGNCATVGGYTNRTINGEAMVATQTHGCLGRFPSCQSACKRHDQGACTGRVAPRRVAQRSRRVSRRRRLPGGLPGGLPGVRPDGGELRRVSLSSERAGDQDDRDDRPEDRDHVEQQRGTPRPRCAAGSASRAHLTVRVPNMPACAVAGDLAEEGVGARLEVDRDRVACPWRRSGSCRRPRRSGRVPTWIARLCGDAGHVRHRDRHVAGRRGRLA